LLADCWQFGDTAATPHTEWRTAEGIRGRRSATAARVPPDHIIQSEVLHPLFGVVGLLLAPLFVLGSLEFVGPFEVRGWKLAGALVPFAYIGWSVWLLALGIGLLATA
jgi:hypothetical protein